MAAPAASAAASAASLPERAAACSARVAPSLLLLPLPLPLPLPLLLLLLLLLTQHAARQQSKIMARPMKSTAFVRNGQRGLRWKKTGPRTVRRDGRSAECF